MTRLLSTLLLLLTLACASATTFAQQPETFNPGDMISFDIEKTAVVEFGINKFEVMYDSSGTWTSIGMPSALFDGNTLPGGESRRFVPQGLKTGTHTLVLRACGSDGACFESDPFVFAFNGASPKPVNVRKVPKQ